MYEPLLRPHLVAALIASVVAEDSRIFTGEVLESHTIRVQSISSGDARVHERAHLSAKMLASLELL